MHIVGTGVEPTARPALRALDLVLTSRCNLRCAYCFESGKRKSAMSWEVARAALDAALRSSSATVSVVFFGGEPVLEFATIRRSIDYAAAQPSGGRLRFSLVTNGTLLGPEESAFLAAHDVATQISFDGVREAQIRRGAGTFERLDALLARIRDDHPEFYAKGLSIAMTVSPRTIPYFARSVAFFIERGIGEIAVAADMTTDHAWADPMIASLDRAFEEVAGIVRAHFARTGRQPLSLFRKRSRLGEPAPGAVAVCGVPRGDHLAVDVDGTLACCGVFVPSIQSRPRTALAASQADLSAGNVQHADLEGAVVGIHRRALASPFFGDKREQYSSFGRCGTCRYVHTCRICPRSIALIPGNEDPKRVPGFACAFNRVWMKYRERFPEERPLSRGQRRRRKARLRRELAAFAEGAGPA